MADAAEVFQKSLVSFGISVDDPCDFSVLGNQITKMTEDYIKETRESITDLSMKAMGPASFVVLKQLLGEVLGAAGGVAAAYADKLMSDIVAKGLGSVYSVLALAITTVSGFQLIINYLAVIALKTALEKRMAMRSVIETDIRILIAFIQNLLKFLTTQGVEGLSGVELTKALKELNAAAVILGTELSKLENYGAYNASKQQITSAIKHIENSISALVGPSYSVASSALDQITQETFPDYSQRLDDLGLKTTGGGIGDDAQEVINYGKFISRVKKVMNNDFSSELAKKVLGTHSFDSAANAKIAVMDGYLNKIFPILPQFARLIMVQELVGSTVNRLVKRLPLGFGLASKFTVLLKGNTT